MLRAHHRAASVALFGLILGLASAPSVGCGSGDARQGQAGDSCTRTDDCVAPLACRGAVCVDGNATTSSSSSASSSSSSSGAGGMGAGGNGGMGGTTTSSSSTSSTSSSSSSSGAGGSGSSSSSSSSSGGGAGGSGGGNVLDPVACAACLDQQCMVEEAACDASCIGIEACIESLCANLSMLGSPDEGACQVHCQSLYPASAKPHHIAVVNCALGAACNPCSSNPFDYNACVASADGGDCAAALTSCQASVDCPNYRDCVATCTTLQQCLACDDTPSGMAGAALLATYQQCIAGKCIAEDWLP